MPDSPVDSATASSQPVKSSAQTSPNPGATATVAGGAQAVMASHARSHSTGSAASGKKQQK